MKFPEELTSTAIDSDTKQLIPGVALILMLQATVKNDYFVGPVITDEDGQAVFARIACQKAIDASQKMFVMDYSGDLESCKPVAHINLHDPDSITRMISQFESDPLFWGSGFDAPELLFSALRRVRNSAFRKASITLTETEMAERSTALIFLKQIEG